MTLFAGANCLDLANFQEALVAETDVADQLVRDGLKCAYINAALEDISQELVDEFKPRGVHFFAAYGFNYWGEPARTDRERDLAIDLAKRNGMGAVVGDAEWWGAGGGQTVASRIAELHRFEAAVEAAGLELLIYTSRYFWTSMMGNTTEFSRHRLIDANWTYDLSHHDELVLGGYGGWTRCAGQQIASSGTETALGPAPDVGGVSVDFDVIYDPDLIGEDDMGMTPEAVQALIDATIERRLDDGTIVGADIVGTDTLLPLIQQAIGMVDSTFTVKDSAGKDVPDPRPGQIRAYLAGLAAGPANVAQVYADIGRILSQAGAAATQAGQVRAGQ